MNTSFSVWNGPKNPRRNPADFLPFPPSYLSLCVEFFRETNDPNRSRICPKIQNEKFRKRTRQGFPISSDRRNHNRANPRRCSKVSCICSSKKTAINYRLHFSIFSGEKRSKQTWIYVRFPVGCQTFEQERSMNNLWKRKWGEKASSRPAPKCWSPRREWKLKWRQRPLP